MKIITHIKMNYSEKELITFSLIIWDWLKPILIGDWWTRLQGYTTGPKDGGNLFTSALALIAHNHRHKDNDGVVLPSSPSTRLLIVWQNGA